MAFRLESPLFSGAYRTQPGKPGTLPTAQCANDSVDGAIHLIRGITGVSAISFSYFSYEIRFLHLPGAYHAPCELNG
jgi:hypothetical protein